MWRWRRHRSWLVALVLPPTYLSSPTAPRCSGSPGLTSAAAAVPVEDCAGLEALPSPIVEDLSLTFDGIEAIVCEKLLTLTVNSGSELSWRLPASGDDEGGLMGSALRLHNVRVVVEEGATLTVGMAVERVETETRADEHEASAEKGRGGSSTITTLTLEGATQQGSNGGALEVKHGGEAMFLVPVRFAGNSVTNGYSGGALHVDGEVTFTHAAHFAGNRAAVAAAFGKGGGGATVSSSSVSVSSAAKSGPSLPTSPWRHRDVDRRPCGGAVSVGKSGRISFWEFASFEDNYSAGRGGAVCNRGWVKLFRRSFFNGNQAAGVAHRDASTLLVDRDGWLVDGNGGALCTEEGSWTTFTRRSSMLRNRAGGSGGAVFNGGGIVMFETSAEFRGNEAEAAGAVSAGASAGLDIDIEAGGGHVFNRGFLHIKGDVSFRDGHSGTDGGAVFAVSGEDTMLAGISSFEGNTAGGICEDVFSSVAGSEVELTTTSASWSAAASAAVPLPAAATNADVAAMASVASAATSPSPDDTSPSPADTLPVSVSAAGVASSSGVAATAPIGTKPRRRSSSRVSRSESGGDIDVMRDSGRSRRKRTSPCQP